MFRANVTSKAGFLLTTSARFNRAKREMIESLTGESPKSRRNALGLVQNQATDHRVNCHSFTREAHELALNQTRGAERFKLAPWIVVARIYRDLELLEMSFTNVKADLGGSPHGKV